MPLRDHLGSFDTLGYARSLRDGGIAPEQAQTHAEAARQFTMPDLTTKDDLRLLKDELTVALEMQALRITVQVGVMLAAAVSLLAALLGAMSKFH